MPDLLVIVLIAQAIILLIVVFSSMKTVRTYRDIDKSFTKLGYIIREDSKKYFQEVGGKMFGDNKVAEDNYKKMIAEALIQAISSQNNQASKIMEQTNADIQQIISKAHQTARDIVSQAEDQSVEINKKIMEEMTLIVEQVVSEYVKQNYSATDQEKFIIKNIKDIDLK